MKTETEIPTAHEFISVRCKSHAGNNQQAHQQHNNKGPFTSSSSSSNASTDGSGNNTATTNNGSGNNNNNVTKVYKDMFAFVPLKPLVEDRIRKYEESKRKFLYTHKKLEERGKKLENALLENNQKENIVFSQDHERKNGNSKISSDSKHASLRLSDLPEKLNRELPEILTGNEDRLSVLVLGLDAQSHMNFIRQMPKTYQFLVSKNLSSIGMYGYTKVGDNTFPNIVSGFSGLSVDELISRCWPTKDSYFDSCPFIWRKFAEAGYRTSLAEDTVWMGTFNYEKKGFLQPPTDYYLNPMTYST